MTLLRRYWWAVAILAAAVVIGLIAGGPSSTKPAYDPTSTAPNGTKALVLLLGALGAHVDVGPTAPKGSTALVLADRLNSNDRNRLLDWVSAGHRLVVTVPSSSLANVAADSTGTDQLGFAGGDVNLPPSCDLDLGPVQTIRPQGGDLLEAGLDETGCFGLGAGDFLVARPLGSGVVIVLGGPQLWTNANLNKADNSVLAAVLLAPQPGAQVTVVGTSRVGGGHSGLLSLISPELKELFWQLVIAFVLLALWRARRLGRPVPETLPVDLPGSEIVVATGHLYQEAGHRDRAAGLLREDLQRDLTRRLGIPGHAGPELVAGVTASRTGVTKEEVYGVLTAPPPLSDAQLIDLAHTIDKIRQEVNSAASR
jgi:hypothetical protein